MLSRASLLGAVAAIATFITAVPPAQAQRCDTNLRVVNNSRSNVTRIYYNPSTISSWGPDRLGGQVLRPGQSIVFRLGNEVPHDFRVVWRGNEAAEARHTDICRISAVLITEDGLRVR
jgi:hypothetical protein